MAKSLPTGSNEQEPEGLELDVSSQNGVRGNVLRWMAAPVESSFVCGTLVGPLYESLIGNHGCRVFLGTTEDLTGWVLRVYSGDYSLGLFPRTKEDWSDLQSWADGPTVLDDIPRYGEKVESDRSRRRRSN